MTATNVLLIGLIISVFWFGGKILHRLPKMSDHLPWRTEQDELAGEICDYFALFRIDALTELNFEVSFADEWSTGRPFMLYGPERMDERELPAEMKREGRFGVHIHPTAHWFKRSRIGYVRVYEGGSWEVHIGLPYQIARQILDDVRRDPNQLVMIGFSKVTDKDGTISYPVYSIELSEPFD